MSFNPGDVVTVDFPGVTGIKRRPGVILSSVIYRFLNLLLYFRKGDEKPITS